ncbi:MAG: DAK2 domain-containing protein [Clostridia bacterium]|nr:DAK2 domain-containing protein [Clostridia bacterium]
METRTINGESYAHMLMGGAAMLKLHVDELNALNVFPVADGDTGTNMLKTLEGGLSSVREECGESVGDFSDKFSRGVLLSARGNSGVILSQIFAGINDGLKEHESVDALELAAAYTEGIARSYAAVQKPAEGTILTVFRESTEYASEHIDENSSVQDFLRLHIEEAKRSLASTKERLPALKEADVVDSGAAGYLYIAEGMYEALEGKEISYDFNAYTDTASVNIDSFTRDSVMEYGYCTEFLIRLMSSKVDPDSFDAEIVTAMLEGMGGDSIVAYKQDDILKVHVHTFSPGEVLARMQSFGEFLTVKVENMNLGHTGAEPKKEKKAPKKSFAVVSVAQGDGMAALFENMGADAIVSGGQSSNPSIEDFISAFEGCDAEDIIVLPNNKNILLAAKQAAEIYRDARVHVVGTKNIAQGYSALSVITPGIKDIDALVSSAERAAADVIDGEITCAVRDAVVEGQNIRTGDYIAISGGSIVAVSDNPEDALMSMLSEADIELCEIITLFVGSNVSEEKRARITEHLGMVYDDYEIVVYEGGQEIYDYLVAVE